MVNKPFDYVIPGAADRDKSPAGAVYSLMVCGIYLAAVSVKLIKEITAAQITVKNIVKLVAPDPFVVFGGVDMLCDVAAEMDVYKLEPFADTKHGLFLCHKAGKDFKLQDIKRSIDMKGAVVGLAEKGGCDVAAAGKKKVRGGVRPIGVQTDKTGNAQPF